MQPACPAFCLPDTGTASPLDAGQQEPEIAIPLYDSTGFNCSGHASCNDDIAMQPFNPVRVNRATAFLRPSAFSDRCVCPDTLQLTLNDQYADRAVNIIERYSKDSHRLTNTSQTNPFLLYVAFAHTHTPLAYSERFSNASHRPGFQRVFGNTLYEVDHAIGRIVEALDANGVANDTLIFVAADNGYVSLD